MDSLSQISDFVQDYDALWQNAQASSFLDSSLKRLEFRLKTEFLSEIQPIWQQMMQKKEGLMKAIKDKVECEQQRLSQSLSVFRRRYETKMGSWLSLLERLQFESKKANSSQDLEKVQQWQEVVTFLAQNINIDNVSIESQDDRETVGYPIHHIVMPTGKIAEAKKLLEEAVDEMSVWYSYWKPEMPLIPASGDWYSRENIERKIGGRYFGSFSSEMNECGHFQIDLSGGPNADCLSKKELECFIGERLKYRILSNDPVIYRADKLNKIPRGTIITYKDGKASRGELRKEKDGICEVYLLDSGITCEFKRSELFCMVEPDSEIDLIPALSMECCLTSPNIKLMQKGLEEMVDAMKRFSSFKKGKFTVRILREHQMPNGTRVFEVHLHEKLLSMMEGRTSTLCRDYRLDVDPTLQVWRSTCGRTAGEDGEELTNGAADGADREKQRKDSVPFLRSKLERNLVRRIVILEGVTPLLNTVVKLVEEDDPELVEDIRRFESERLEALAVANAPESEVEHQCDSDKVVDRESDTAEPELHPENDLLAEANSGTETGGGDSHDRDGEESQDSQNGDAVDSEVSEEAKSQGDGSEDAKCERKESEGTSEDEGSHEVGSQVDGSGEESHEGGVSEEGTSPRETETGANEEDSQEASCAPAESCITPTIDSEQLESEADVKSAEAAKSDAESLDAVPTEEKVKIRWFSGSSDMLKLSPDELALALQESPSEKRQVSAEAARQEEDSRDHPHGRKEAVGYFPEDRKTCGMHGPPPQVNRYQASGQYNAGKGFRGNRGGRSEREQHGRRGVFSSPPASQPLMGAIHTGQSANERGSRQQDRGQFSGNRTPRHQETWESLDERCQGRKHSARPYNNRNPKRQGPGQRPDEVGARYQEVGQRPDEVGARYQEAGQRPDEMGARLQESGQRPDDKGAKRKDRFPDRGGPKRPQKGQPQNHRGPRQQDAAHSSNVQPNRNFLSEQEPCQRNPTHQGQLWQQKGAGSPGQRMEERSDRPLNRDQSNRQRPMPADRSEAGGERRNNKKGRKQQKQPPSGNGQRYGDAYNRNDERKPCQSGARPPHDAGRFREPLSQAPWGMPMSYAGEGDVMRSAAQQRPIQGLSPRQTQSDRQHDARHRTADAQSNAGIDDAAGAEGENRLDYGSRRGRGNFFYDDRSGKIRERLVGEEDNYEWSFSPPDRAGERGVEDRRRMPLVGEYQGDRRGSDRTKYPGLTEQAWTARLFRGILDGIPAR